MTTYEIWEDGNGKFAEIEAEDAEDALELAEASYPRRARDYNGWTGMVRWYAHGPDGDSASVYVEVTEIAT